MTWKQSHILVWNRLLGLRITLCHTLNVCVSPTFICWNPISNVMVSGGGGLGRRLGHECGALRNEISALIKENSLHLSSPVWGHSKKMAICKPEIGPLPGNWIWPLNFVLPASRTCGKNSCCSSHRVYNILLRQHELSKTTCRERACMLQTSPVPWPFATHSTHPRLCTQFPQHPLPLCPLFVRLF